MAKENATIVIPGIQGSGLENLYSLDPEVTWSASEVALTQIFGPSLDSLALDASGKDDKSLEIVTRGRGPLPIAYAPLLSRLRATSALPVYVFGYDWRKSVEVAAESLADFVDRIVGKLSRSASADWTGRIDFVCHSMGGLVLRAFLKRKPKMVGRIVFIAVPHRGSLDAIEAMVRGESVILGGRKEMRKLARTLPGVYELLPFGLKPDPLLDSQGTPLEVFDVHSWQENVTNLSNPDKSGYDVEQEHLDDARQVLGSLPILPTTDYPASDILTIYGDIPDSTLVQIREKPNNKDFDFTRKAEGDGVVPIASALLSGVQSVLLTKDQISYLSLSELPARANMHAFMPRLDEVQSITDGFLKTGTVVLPRNMLSTALWTPS